MNEQRLDLAIQFLEHPVRMVGTNEHPEWVAADVCPALGLEGDPGQHTRKFKPSEKGLISIQTPGGVQSMLTVTEAGLYRLIFKSRKPEAEQFQNWIFNDVLPSIRKFGCYPAPVSDSAFVGNSVIVPVDANNLAMQLQQGLQHGLAPFVKQITESHCQLKDEFHDFRNETREEFQTIKLEIEKIAKRKDLTESTQRLHIAVVHRFYGGKCPCCAEQQIVSQCGIRLPEFAVFDHWTLRSKNGPADTWAVCKACNQQLEDADWREQKQIEFKCFQAKRRQHEYRPTFFDRSAG